MENLNVVNDTQQAVVAPAKECTNNSADSVGTPESVRSAEVADRVQSARENSGFRKMRLENEKYKREVEQLKTRLSRLSELENIKAQSDVYLEKLISDKMNSDLESIRKLDPSVSSLESLGGDFIRLIENGVDAAVAFGAVKRATEGKVTPKPPVTGAVGRSDSPRNKYYTSKELDRLTARDLENPAIFRKAMESLKNL